MSECDRASNRPHPGVFADVDLDNLVARDGWPDPTTFVVYDQETTDLTPHEVKRFVHNDREIPFQPSKRLHASALNFAELAKTWDGCTLNGDALSADATHLWVLLSPEGRNRFAESLEFFERADLTVAVIIENSGFSEWPS